MIDWILNNKEWIFSGIGIAAISAIAGALRYFLKKKNKKEVSKNINIHGDKSVYVENNDGEININ